MEEAKGRENVEITSVKQDRGLPLFLEERLTEEEHGIAGIAPAYHRIKEETPLKKIVFSMTSLNTFDKEDDPKGVCTNYYFEKAIFPFINRYSDTLRISNPQYSERNEIFLPYLKKDYGHLKNPFIALSQLNGFTSHVNVAKALKLQYEYELPDICYTYFNLYRFLFNKINLFTKQYFGYDGNIVIKDLSYEVLNDFYNLVKDGHGQWFNFICNWLENFMYSFKDRFVDKFKNKNIYSYLGPLYASTILWLRQHPLDNLYGRITLIKMDPNDELYKSLDTIFNINKHYYFTYWLVSSTTKVVHWIDVYRRKNGDYLVVSKE